MKTKLIVLAFLVGCFMAIFGMICWFEVLTDYVGDATAYIMKIPKFFFFLSVLVLLGIKKTVRESAAELIFMEHHPKEDDRPNWLKP